MKKSLLLSLLIILLMGNLTAQEVQMSFGLESAFGLFAVNNNFSYTVRSNSIIIGSNLRDYDEKTTSWFFAPGVSFSTRYLFDADSYFSAGFFYVTECFL